MQRLILLRHGKAVPEGEAQGDRERALVPRGREEAAKAAARIADLDFADVAILASPAQRTRETAEILAARLGGPVTWAEELYMAGTEQIWDIADAHARANDAATVCVVGHNPGLHALARALLDQTGERSAAARALSEGLPTAAFAAFDLAGEVLDAAGPRLLAAWRP